MIEPLKKIPLTYMLACTMSLIVMGDVGIPDVAILLPVSSDSISYDPGKILIVSTSAEAGNTLVLSTQWEKTKVFDLTIEGLKENFAKEFYKVFEPKTTLQFLTYSMKYFKGYSKPESLFFSYTDSMSVRRLWQLPEFAQFVKSVQKTTEVSEIVVTLKGWSDSTYSTVYEDPINPGRALYKMQVRLLPGTNTVYCAPNGKKEKAIAYSTTLLMDSKPNADRANHFHFSVLEQSCATCHEGLPSADSGASMKADCNVCHKAMSSGASYLHSPAEMKECGSCHSWSPEHKAVVVEKGVPETCYGCHNEKQAQVENSTYPHPVASECVTCHSPHGTDQQQIVKEDVYTLCTGCHEEQKQNHPVGRHPLRFIELNPGHELSCISCHNPHGSQYESLFRVPGGKLEMCAQCH